jgi:ribosomal protein S24E
MTTITKIQEHDNPLLKRKNIVLNMEYPTKATPSEVDIKKEVASFIKAKENTIAIKKIDQQFGSTTAHITIHAYHDEKTLEQTETINKKKKEGAKKDGKESKTKE